MTATLYVPNQPLQLVATNGLSLPTTAGYAFVSEEVARYLDCTRSLVDVLACGPGYVAYSVFDFEGDINQPAMIALSTIAGHLFDTEDEEQQLRGPVLVIAA